MVSDIFSKSDSVNCMIGDGNNLYFYTNGYCGRINCFPQIINYDFGKYVMYDLKKLPTGEFVIDKSEKQNEKSCEQLIKSIIEGFVVGCAHVADIDKHDKYKISRLVAASEIWISDKDVKYLNDMPNAEIFTKNGQIIVKSVTQSDETLMILSNGNAVKADQTSMKNDIDEEEDGEDDE